MTALLAPIPDRALRAAETVAHLRDLDAYEAAHEDSLTAEQLAAMLTECLRCGALDTRLPVPGWVDPVSRRQGPAPAFEIAADLVAADDGLMTLVLGVLGRAMATDPQARAAVAAMAHRYGTFHGGKA